MATKKTTKTTATATAETVSLASEIATENSSIENTVQASTAEIETSKATGLKATAKTLAEYERMDYAGRRIRLFGGLKSEAVDGGSIILPTSDACNFDKFFCVDSGEVYIFYKGTWYKQSS